MSADAFPARRQRLLPRPGRRASSERAGWTQSGHPVSLLRRGRLRCGELVRPATCDEFLAVTDALGRTRPYPASSRVRHARSRTICKHSCCGHGPRRSTTPSAGSWSGRADPATFERGSNAARQPAHASRQIKAHGRPRRVRRGLFAALTDRTRALSLYNTQQPRCMPWVCRRSRTDGRGPVRGRLVLLPAVRAASPRRGRRLTAATASSSSRIDPRRESKAFVAYLNSPEDEDVDEAGRLQLQPEPDLLDVVGVLHPRRDRHPDGGRSSAQRRSSKACVTRSCSRPPRAHRPDAQRARPRPRSQQRSRR